jgi:hypothetical protein
VSKFCSQFLAQVEQSSGLVVQQLNKRKTLMEKNLQSSWFEVAKTNVFNHSLRVEVPKKPHESTTVTSHKLHVKWQRNTMNSTTNVRNQRQ